MISEKRHPAAVKARSTFQQFPRVKSGFLQFSHRVDYALLLLMELARSESNEPVSLRAVAKKNFMSFYFLQKVALDLRKADIIRSGRGKNGGYVLDRSPEQLTLKEILETMEGPITIMQCLGHISNNPACVRKSWCGLRHGLGFINQTVVKAFSQTTLHHLLQTP